jgi:uncharacterized protein with ATP-grasp and redox domains
MKTHDKCLACFRRQAAEACIMAGLSAGQRKDAIAAVKQKIASFPTDHPPVEMAADIHELVR